ncbi:hypothetical protein EYC84_004061 [Monilinia fructicola]|uniref:Uncharacterized protein n=1 Tax=Monilinia fructicola TaxID=38448 RepID=A0A5M9JZ30_MONFR|nr:hypothetical protein EYC84_004061 [Monilinia fructicola]
MLPFCTSSDHNAASRIFSFLRSVPTKQNKHIKSKPATTSPPYSIAKCQAGREYPKPVDLVVSKKSSVMAGAPTCGPCQKRHDECSYGISKRGHFPRKVIDGSPSNSPRENSSTPSPFQLPSEVTTLLARILVHYPSSKVLQGKHRL